MNPPKYGNLQFNELIICPKNYLQYTIKYTISLPINRLYLHSLEMKKN